MTTTTEVSDSLERVDSVINMLDEICDHMDGFSSAEEAWLSSITETLRTWRYVTQETHESPGYVEPTFTVGSSGLADVGRCDPPWVGSPLIVIALLLGR